MRHVLVVDGEAEVCRVVRAALERSADCRVSIALDGRTAISLLDPPAPDLVILDAALPVVSGIVLAQRAAGRGIPFILATDNDQMMRFLVDGGVRPLRKPFRVAVLVHEVETALRDAAADAPRLRANLDALARNPALAALTERCRAACATKRRAEGPGRTAPRKRSPLEDDPDTVRAAFSMIENFGADAAGVAERRAVSAGNEEASKRWLEVARAIRELKSDRG